MENIFILFFAVAFIYFCIGICELINNVIDKKYVSCSRVQSECIDGGCDYEKIS